MSCEKLHSVDCATKRIKAVGAVILAGVLTLAAGCSATGGKQAKEAAGITGGGVDTPRYTVAMISHGAPGDTFWDLVRAGAEDAAKKNNLELRYSSNPQAPEQANLVQNAIDSHVDGIALTLPNADALGPVARKAAQDNITTVGLNAGMSDYSKYGISAFFGQDETVSGEAAGKRLAKEKARKVLCVIHEQGNSSQESRCAGVKKGLGSAGSMEILYVNGMDLTSVESTVEAKLAQDKSVDWIMGLQAPVAMTAQKAADAAGSQAKVATFDTDSALVNAIQQGKIAFAIDQQPYLQGYMAIDALWLAKRNGSMPGGGQPVYTGPSFIDQSNVDTIADAAQAGLR
ncbi:substrate-binding domain-containing protein [Corynebacterium sp. zg254]|uniref:Sugar ABC transporter substrate-binding protein n=1 Tax=Corynebacterium zhongnanshanii TaxID=2768834 RepID=A0ABQ6VER7_9CORY|nr:sugar ABC transporter substrate-binding protein [Corynebacterium zhongnanshanii]MCR5913991.1 substrate-binding domain-containing protein [Corynebacterium sp. zg254]